MNELHQDDNNNNNATCISPIFSPEASRICNLLGKNLANKTMIETNIADLSIFSQVSIFKPKDVLMDPFELIDSNGKTFYIKKCFIKFLINRIFHNIKLPSSETVVDIKGELHIINPNDDMIYQRLIELSPIGEILFNNNNRYVMSMDTNNVKHFLNKKLLFNQSYIDHNSTTNDILSFKTQVTKTKSKKGTKKQFHKITINKNSIQSDGTMYVKIYDIASNSYLIPEEQLFTIFDLLINKEPFSPNIIFTNEQSEKISLNINKIRANPRNYSSDNDNGKMPIASTDTNANECPFPYVINKKEVLSHFEVTNCVDGKKTYIQIYTLLKIVRDNAGKDFIFLDSEGKVKLCIEELKEIVKNDSKVECYLKLKNITGSDSYIPKNYILNYIKKFIDNNITVTEILSVKSNVDTGEIFFDMKNICASLISVASVNLMEDDILKNNANTFILTKRGFQSVNCDPNCELFEFVQLEDDTNEKIYIRKPFIRNILYNCAINKENIPLKVEVIDFNHKKRKINLNVLVQKYTKVKSPYGNIEVIFKVREVFIEVIHNNRKYMISKNDIKIINEIYCYKKGCTKIRVSDYQYNKIGIDLAAIRKANINKEWILIEDINLDKILVFNGIIKQFIIKRLYEKRNQSEQYVEVSDYNNNNKKILVDKILNNYIYEKSMNKQKQIVIKVLNKNPQP